MNIKWIFAPNLNGFSYKNGTTIIIEYRSNKSKSFLHSALQHHTLIRRFQMNAIQNRYKMSDAKICGRASKKRERKRKRKRRTKERLRARADIVHPWMNNHFTIRWITSHRWHYGVTSAYSHNHGIKLQIEREPLRKLTLPRRSIQNWRIFEFVAWANSTHRNNSHNKCVPFFQSLKSRHLWH